MGEMVAGRELDALVAEKVMGEPRPTGNVPEGVLAGVTTSASEGGNWIGTTTGFASGDEPVWIPKPYSTDISAAWGVVEKLRALGFNVVVSCHYGMKTWDVRGWKDDNTARFIAHADTAPETICLAALKAVGAPAETPVPEGGPDNEAR